MPLFEVAIIEVKDGKERLISAPVPLIANHAEQAKIDGLILANNLVRDLDGEIRVLVRKFDPEGWSIISGVTITTKS